MTICPNCKYEFKLEQIKGTATIVVRGGRAVEVTNVPTCICGMCKVHFFEAEAAYYFRLMELSDDLESKVDYAEFKEKEDNKAKLIPPVSELDLSTKAVLLFSGGFDSTVLLHDLLEESYKPVLYFFDYGQKSVKQERANVTYWATKHNLELIDQKIPDLPSAYPGADYIPLRNLIFVANAASYAEREGIKEIFAGFVGPDHYRDTSETFTKVMDAFIYQLSGIEFKAPYVKWVKSDINDQAIFLEIDHKELFENTFSCNHPNEQGNGCGTCSDCIAVNNYKNMV